MTSLMTALGIIRSAGAELCRPWPRHILATSDWRRLAASLAGDHLALIALWADTTHVHALFFDATDIVIVPVSAAVEAGLYPALSPHRPGAAWFERAIKDLWGHTAEGGTDGRAWLDHGHWPLSLPLSPRPGPPPHPVEPPVFLGEPEDGRMRAPIGPVWGHIEAAAHLRLTLHHGHVTAAECLLGYGHKGTLALMRGKSPRAAARFAARLAGDMTVAHGLAFATATEAALDLAVPPRAIALRASMAEIERIMGHLAILSAVATAAGFPAVSLRCGQAREILARAVGAVFGHRLMMDAVIPGGLAGDIAAEDTAVLTRALAAVADALPGLQHAFGSAALAGRLDGLGVTARSQAEAFAAGGVVGRAAGRVFDARFFTVDFQRVETEADGDAGSRCRLRLREIVADMRAATTRLAALPDGPVAVPLPNASGEGIGFAESARGDVWYWLRLDHGQIAAIFPRDPGWALWPLLEQALRGAAYEDVGLIRASFGLTESGMDL